MTLYAAVVVLSAVLGAVGGVWIGRAISASPREDDHDPYGA